MLTPSLFGGNPRAFFLLLFGLTFSLLTILPVEARFDKVSRETCVQKNFNITDKNYGQVLDYFQRCYNLGLGLSNETRKAYMYQLSDHIFDSAMEFIDKTALDSQTSRLIFEELNALRNFVRFPTSVAPDYGWHLEMARSARVVRQKDQEECDCEANIEVKTLIAITVLFLALIVLLTIMLFKVRQPPYK